MEKVDTEKKIEEKQKSGKKAEEIKEEIAEEPITKKELKKELNEDLELKKLEREKERIKEKVAAWQPKTKLGKEIKEGKIKNIDEIFDKGLKILEPEIVDALLSTGIELISIGQAKGKFGGGKRRLWRQTQKKTAEGNVPSFGCMVIVGDSAGHVGIGYGKSRETLPAKAKALREAKLSIVRIKRGCGSFDCYCGEEHSIPFTVEGKVGSAVIKIMPAPKGTGLVIDDECKKILKLAGIKDVYSRTFGQTRIKINLAKACLKALQHTMEMKK